MDKPAPSSIESNSLNRELFFKAITQKKLLINCIQSLHNYFRSKEWRQFYNKFQSLGYEIPKDLISCKVCDENTEGYYFYGQKKIILCANNILDKDFSTDLTNKLVLAYDDARAEIEPSNPNHIACSTIRANNLDGHCKSTMFRFGFIKDRKSYRNCVVNSSIKQLLKAKSLSLSESQAEEAVLGLWQTCIKDYDPFTFEDIKKYS